MATLKPDEAEGGARVCAFLDMIAYSELGPKLIALSDDGYNVVVGSTPAKPILFDSYDEHPRLYQANMNSDAAGRYQFMGRYWPHYKAQLRLPDFGKRSQDLWAIQLIRECKAIATIQVGAIEDAIRLCRSRWASFPGAGYGQPEHRMEPLVQAFRDAMDHYA